MKKVQTKANGLHLYFSVHKLMEMHEGSSTTTTTTADPSAPGGVSVERPDNYEPPVLDAV